MDIDIAILSNSVKSPDSLFKQPGIQRQIIEYKMMGKLKIASFAANL
jgi:hypothetical protein